MSQRLRTLAVGAFAAVLLVFPAVLLGGLGAFLWQEYGAAALAAASAGLLAAAWTIRRRVRAEATSIGDGPAKPHGGISMSAVPIAGGVGLLITIGYVVMFWFGAPGYRPLVLGVAAAGGLFGLLLIRRARSRPQQNDRSILRLDREVEDPKPADRPHPEGKDDLRFTSEPWRVRVGRV